MKPTQEQVMDMMKECNLIEIVARHDDGTVTAQIPNITNMKRFAALAYEVGRKDERERILDMCKEGLWDGGGIKFHLDKQGENNDHH